MTENPVMPTRDVLNPGFRFDQIFNFTAKPQHMNRTKTFSVTAQTNSHCPLKMI